LASGGQDRVVRFWDATTGREAAAALEHGQSVTSVAFAADGSAFASGSADGQLRQWDWPSGKLCWEAGGLQIGSWGYVATAFSPDGRTLAAGTGGGNVRLWDRATGRELARFDGHRGWARSIAFSPDGAALLSGSDDATAYYWDLTQPPPEQ